MYFKTLLELENLSHPHWSLVFRLKWRGSKIRNDESNGDLFESQSKASSLFSSFLTTQPWLIELTTLSPLFLSYAEDRLHWLPKPSAQFPQHFLYWYIVVHFQTNNLISKESATKLNNASHIPILGCWRFIHCFPIPGCWRFINWNRIKVMGWSFYRMHLNSFCFIKCIHFPMGFPGGSVVMQKMQVHSWVGKIPQRRKWQPIPVFLPGKFHGQRSLVGYSPWGHKEYDMTETLSMHTYIFILRFRRNMSPALFLLYIKL